MANIPYFTFNNGQKVPSIGMGCWMGDVGGGELVKDMCTKALAAGYRHFDTVSRDVRRVPQILILLRDIGCRIRCVGKLGRCSDYRSLTSDFIANEEQVGRAIRESGIPREELFVTTKLGFDHSHVRESFEESLQKLGVDYIDLYLIHWPNHIVDRKAFTPEDFPTIVDTWKEMEKLLDTGKVKSIGVSNFSIKTLTQLLPHCKVIPATNQVELHPFLPQLDLKAFCEEHGILLTAYSPLGQPHPEKESIPALFADPTITGLAEKYKATIAQILISWSVQRGVVAIPKSANAERMKANITLVKLDEADMTAINSIHEQPGKHRQLIVYPYSEPGEAFGWKYEWLGWNRTPEGVVIE
ncbi:Aldo/keto reductase [Dentipellis sp. KUC8613]|nr:Aldo/keto reductase [Dentipellis sp. KUC8613]